ncbi:hypothetical protein MNBD_GAMMA10-3217 [hydrothermal vent metagenome]|uniref:Cytochrome c domain-containing protein n=1 Tax=hydrothermal vent metagenome TaxID=652676 RepID=A0A3B0XJE4_9ZZZZ
MKHHLIIPLLFLTPPLLSCANDELQAPGPATTVPDVPSNWLKTQQQRIADKETYIKNHSVAYDWFANFPFSNTEGTPFILLKLLPLVAPQLWGTKENFLDTVGLFKDTRIPGYPVARGIGISAFSRSPEVEAVDYASFTCAACHIGRVRNNNGGFIYLDGGVNAEFNIVKYRVLIYQTLQKIYAPETKTEMKTQLAMDAFMSALDKVHANDKHYFYNNYQSINGTLDAHYEKIQVALFKKNAAKLIGAFIKRAESEYLGFAALLDKNYSGFQTQALAGFPGMADATGISAVNAYIDAQGSFFSRLFSSFILPGTPGITDFMTVWEQNKRTASWDDKHKKLINGGGQWNGNIPIPLYRNLAAQLTLGFKDNDIRVSAFSVDLLYGLPATPYPFDVDEALASKGMPLFKEHCADCHQPHNGKVYKELATNSDRSYVVGFILRQGALSSFNAQCSAETTVIMAGKKVMPCAQFDGVSLKGKKELIMSPYNEHHGYNARPLSGVWAQAPYLHNGSVPTMYHLLMPGERPASFIKSRLDYDRENLGFSWNPLENSPKNTQKNTQGGYLFDSRAFSAFSNGGHDTDIRVNTANGEKVYKLDWSDDKPGARALIEYMKIL